MLANIDNQGYTASGDISIKRFRFLIEVLHDQFDLSADRMGDMLIAGQQMLKEKYGRNISLMELTEATYKVRDTAGKGERPR